MNGAVEGFELAVVIAGLALSTFVTRTSFLLAGGKIRLNQHIESALRYAPVCTLAAIIVPNVLLHGPGYDFSPFNPRLVGALGAGVWLCFSRNMLGCLASGMLAYSLARVLL